MTRWEYATVTIEYDGKRRKDWALTLADGTVLVGLPQILETYGNRGWELVGLNVDRSEIYSGFAKWISEPASYRATFKRQADGDGR